MLRGKRNRIIADYDIGLTEDWYPIDLDPATSTGWPRTLSGELGLTGDSKERLVGRLSTIQETMRRMSTPQLATAVWIPEPQSGEVASILGFGLVQLADDQGPETYLESLAADEGRRELGVEFQNVQTWTAPVEAGLAVGAYNLIAHTDLGEEPRVEERTVIGVFPPRSKEMIECIFTAQSITAYDDIIQQTMGLVATIEVQLERA
ncbi:hypothetical protein L1277_000048 [Okibacterium sp. HSC-33S16]|uniref:hypothetical protein n=1 Tax=Okibacterium sp. HSC-33S16 TaxID=2910965 RepID=UPI00209F9AB4|nr:hypothetical protein [Okibacterium sp. HSC-33S16]MCP2029984.1 hypothetical protein [Okibacterium sp. HSC-33S16]